MPRTKGSKNKKSIIAAETLLTVAEYDEKIAAVENTIAELTAQLKTKKAELKQLVKEREAAIAAEAAKQAEADKAAILAAVEASGKSLDEVLAFLKG